MPNDVSAVYLEALASFLDCVVYPLDDATNAQLEMLAWQAATRLRDMEGQAAVDQMLADAEKLKDMAIA
jgi:hypothetical protein